MFDSLSDRLGDVFDRLRRHGALTEDDVGAALREIRIALLEADVALPVVRDFVAAVRYGPSGVRVNTVHPGYMPPMLNATNAGERDDKIALTPLRRIGKPIEVAYGVLFLASDEASFVTGAELVIDGGFIAQ